jgi:CheY-like chemotaxis protein
MQQTTVLVVEDEPITCEITLGHLQREGFATLCASSGEEALLLLRNKGAGIDWLFTDIELPGCIDGWLVGAEFHLSYPLRPVIYASAHAPRSRSQVAGAVFLPKPYSPAAITTLIRQLSVEDLTADYRTPADQMARLMRGYAAAA